MTEYVRAAVRGELKPGERKVVEIDGVFIAVFNVDDVYYAIEDACTHDDGANRDFAFLTRSECLIDGRQHETLIFRVFDRRHGLVFPALIAM